jgi:hypothetical protein
VARRHRDRGLTLRAMRNYRSVVSFCMVARIGPRSHGTQRRWRTGLGGPQPRRGRQLVRNLGILVCIEA